MKIPIVTTREVTLQQISDLLITAFEGGSHFWCSIKSTQEPLNLQNYRTEPEGRVYPHADYPLNPGGSVTVEAPEDDGPCEIDGKTEWVVNLETIEKGLLIMAQKYPLRFEEVLSENEMDANTADIFLQCVCFGEEIFS